ncbi:MAG TPA: crossover junction endodeoxyribonuclease RuvC [Dissulfurispiraceae bacterium]
MSGKKLLGIDPGSLFCGYGLIYCAGAQESRSRRAVNAHRYLSSGRIILPAGKPLHARLDELYVSLTEVIGEYKPDEVIVEKIFFAKGIKAALSLGHTRGVVLLAASRAGMPIREYSALEVKKAVVGYGRAEKAQVQKMVKEILGIRHTLSPDSADALALALCHANSMSMERMKGL